MDTGRSFGLSNAIQTIFVTVGDMYVFSSLHFHFVLFVCVNVVILHKAPEQVHHWAHPCFSIFGSISIKLDLSVSVSSC